MALALALAISTIASELPARPAHASGADETSVTVLVRSGDAALPDVMAASGPLSPETTPCADDPAADPESDTLGSERAAPEAVTSFGGAALDAPQSSRVQHRATQTEDAVTRAILPVVQPPRG